MPERVTPRAAIALRHLAVLQLLEANGMTNETDISDLTVNVNFRVGRIDLARLSPDGQRIGEWLAGYSIDPRSLATFGTAVPLPGTDGPVQ